ncbi:hypothetical protein NDU88_006621 [Pleurodeles waltl]|uniref:Uncharacterized protein n=1 Tax=Pleurodeles waltl TaxID=8319 RepID=A0AAV7PLH3_PLEWA|nr:hypothetical protein NDU88_006621 [Pleurodeles waltl]
MEDRSSGKEKRDYEPGRVNGGWRRGAVSVCTRVRRGAEEGRLIEIGVKAQSEAYSTANFTGRWRVIIAPLAATLPARVLGWGEEHCQRHGYRIPFLDPPPRGHFRDSSLSKDTLKRTAMLSGVEKLLAKAAIIRVPVAE